MVGGRRRGSGSVVGRVWVVRRLFSVRRGCAGLGVCLVGSIWRGRSSFFLCIRRSRSFWSGRCVRCRLGSSVLGCRRVVLVFRIVVAWGWAVGWLRRVGRSWVVVVSIVRVFVGGFGGRRWWRFRFVFRLVELRRLRERGRGVRGFEDLFVYFLFYGWFSMFGRNV